ncbi:hypothetical protein AB6A40_001444 [Gnathostoma spinigerum]|uniref:Uncharacterized protein n=1 Tax=Gnathostoma spinigerum TaxID=75299 RepID=A0ABD6E468_9BILA
MDIAARYAEQLETTVETMRRRGIAIYDTTISMGQRSVRLADKIREIVEPAAYDVSDAVTSAVQEMSPLDPAEKDMRNSLLELYLGCSVLSIGLSAGEISGAFALAPLLAKIFDTWAEVVLMFIIPYYVYLILRKNAALDETERRVILFSFAMCIGNLGGHLLGRRMASVAPAVAFVHPMILGLAVDTEVSPPGLYSNRKSLLSIAASFSLGISIILASLQGISFAVMLSLILSAIFIAVHFQVVVYQMSNKAYGAGEAQLAYLIGTFIIQFITAALLGVATDDTA